MNLRRLNYYYHRLAIVKAWYFLVIALLFLGLCIYGLRANYSKMVELREAVYAADRANGDVEQPLKDLREHVHGHMNTNLANSNNSIRPPIQLKGRYERLMALEQEKIKAQNAQVAAQAENICSAQFPGAGFNAPRVDCIQKYVSANAVKPSAVAESLYKFDFVSPKWSPDLAGISMLLSIIFFVLFVARVSLEFYIRRRLH